ncbi:hypothetical protein ES705_14426 [subsurface metagenome]
MCKMMNLLILSLCVIKSVYALNPVDVTDMIFNIGGGSEKSFCFKFATGDTIVINASVTKGNDISEISVIQWPTSIKFQAIEIQNIENKKIFVPKTSVYTIKLKNTATFKSKTYQINIKRRPSNEDLVMFNTAVEWDTLYDTTYVADVEEVLLGVDTIPEEIVNTQVKVGSQLSGDYRSYIQIDMPEGTDYLAYWIGVGQEANEGLREMTQKLPEAAVALSIINPVAAFAVGLVPQLFTLSQGQQVDYYFIADYQNLTNFLSGQAFYMIKKGEEVITDYAKMDAPQQRRMYLGLYNSHGRLSDRLVTINIVAVRIEPQYEYRDIKRPVVKKKAVPKLD